MAAPLVVFDVNETLSDLAPLSERFHHLGLPPGLSATWFAGVLRDGFALTAVGVNEQFGVVAEQVLRTVFASQPPNRDVDAAVEHVLAGFEALDVHPDVAPGIEALAAAGTPMATLTNGATRVADGLLARSGLRQHVDPLLSVADAPLWKPAAAAYQYAAQVLGRPVDELLLVAVHPWDIDGAARAGLRTAWVNRSRADYPQHFRPAELEVTGIDQLAERLAGDR